MINKLNNVNKTENSNQNNQSEQKNKLDIELNISQQPTKSLKQNQNQSIPSVSINEIDENLNLKQTRRKLMLSSEKDLKNFYQKFKCQVLVTSLLMIMNF